MVGIPRARARAEVGRGAAVRRAAEGSNNTGWKEEQLKAEVPVCVARGSRFCAVQDSDYELVVQFQYSSSCCAWGQITRAKTIRAPRFRAPRNTVQREEGEKQVKGGVRDLKQAKTA
jgi:hypothetical protein